MCIETRRYAAQGSICRTDALSPVQCMPIASAKGVEGCRRMRVVSDVSDILQ